jgi:hypothetical protein
MTARKRVTILLGGLALAIAMGGCSTMRDQLGLARKKPDEFAVVPKAPLAMPPDFTNLREPEPGAPRPQQVSPAGEARAALLQTRGQAPVAAAGQSATAGEMALVDAAGAAKVDGKVRRDMIQEAREAGTGRSMTERLLFWQGPKKDDMVVDAAEESRRIQRTQRQGEVLTGQGVPVIEKSTEKGLIGRIF